MVAAVVVTVATDAATMNVEADAATKELKIKELKIKELPCGMLNTV